jgi:Putative peptidoglycan binding domain
VFLSQFNADAANGYPSAIAVDTHGNTYLADCGSNPAVYKYDASGALIQTIGLGTISCAFGVAVDGDGNIYVGDNTLLRKYNAVGTELWHTDPDGVGGSGSFGFNTGVVVEGGKVYAADCNNFPASAIDVFDTDGHFLSSFGNGTLDCPYYINSDSGGNIYVPDYTTNTIYKYSSSGSLVSSFKVSNDPKGAEAVEVDSNGFIYAGRYQYGVRDNKIYVFSPGGTLLTTFGSAGSAPGQFSFSDPLFTLDAQNNLYTADNDADFRIQKFSLPALPALSPVWNISAGSTNLSFLNVSNSTAATTISCTNGCVDGGGNTNWVFGAAAPPPAPVTSNGPPVGTSTSPADLPGYVKPRLQIIHANGHVEYLDSTSTVTRAENTTPTIAIPSTATSSNALTIAGVALAKTSLILSKNRQLYDRGEDIRALQKFFNTHGFVVAQVGPGSPGNETSTFGTNTYRTLIKFQKANKLPATGYLGPLTRALINSQAH